MTMTIKRSHKIPSDNFVVTVAANVNNKNISDKDFREFVRNTIGIVEGMRQER